MDPVATPRVKVCGVTSVAQAEACVEAGADLLGVNFVPASPRRVDEQVAASIARAIRGRCELVGVVADQGADELRALRDRVGLDWLQLHGDEPAEMVSALAPYAFKAVRVGSAADVLAARDFPGSLLLIDARVEGTLGGSGVRVEPRWVVDLARARPVLLAGGLRPENVAEAVALVRPWGVDVASGVEVAPGVKDIARVAAFVAAARARWP
jgi:phosphoribosylanthranilate isomerase